MQGITPAGLLCQSGCQQGCDIQSHALICPAAAATI